MRKNCDNNITNVSFSPFEMSSEAPAFKIPGAVNDLEFRIDVNECY